MHLRSVYLLVYIGFLGLLIYFLMRPMVDFHANSPVEMSRETAISRATTVLQELGVDTGGETFMMAVRSQRVRLFQDMVDSLGKSQTLNPATLNASGTALVGWNITHGMLGEDVSAIVDDDVLFDQVGIASVRLDPQGRVRFFQSGERANATFVPGDSLALVLSQVVEKLGFDKQHYAYEPEPGVTLIDVALIPTDNPTSDTYSATFLRTSNTYRGPAFIRIDYVPAVQEVPDSTSNFIQGGIRLNRAFASYHPLDTDVTRKPQISEFNIVLLVLTLILIVAFVVIPSVRLIFRGEVVWRRGLIIFAVLLLGSVGYRALSLQHLYYVLLSDLVVGVDLMFYTIGSLIASGITALAYITWESYARKQQQEQMPLLDAIWTGNLFQRRMGKAILAGYGYAGMALAIWAFGLYTFDAAFYQVDQQLGFTDPTTAFPALATLLNSWLYTWSAAAIYFGVVITLLRQVVRNTILRLSISIVLSAVFLSSGLSLVNTTADSWIQLLIFGLLATPLVMAFVQYGLLSLAVSIWLVFMVLRMGVYLGSPDLYMAMQGWLLATAGMFPFIIGMLMYHFGRQDVSTSSYVPEYVTRLRKQSRLEQEFQIAKESQYALMPRTTPNIAGLDVKGFFLPSFDVGGDFYEHVLVRNGPNDGEELVVSVVDVSGKAMKAALTAIYTSGLLMSRSLEKDGRVAETLRDINTVLYARTDKLTFVTCVYARIDVKTLAMRFGNAGHCLPVLVREGKARFLPSVGVRLPLGVRNLVDYQETAVQLEPGDTLFLYSDGLPEARSKSGQLFGFDEVLELFEKVTKSHTDSQSICEKIKQDMLTFSDYELADDLTLVVIQLSNQQTL